MVIYPIDTIGGGSSSSSRRVGESLGLESWVGGVVVWTHGRSHLSSGRRGIYERVNNLYTEFL